MTAITFTIREKEDIRKYFGVPLEELDLTTFKKVRRELQTKYHPDNFEHLDNDAVKEMATEKFQTIEALSEKIHAYLSNSVPSNGLSSGYGQDFMHPDAVFAGKRLKIEVLTADKDLKYHLFGTHYRWLEYGDSFKIPGTRASIVIDEGHRGRRVGFQESIRMYLTFDEKDSIEDMVEWLYSRIREKASTLIIAGNAIPIDPLAMVNAIKRETYLRIGPPTVEN